MKRHESKRWRAIGLGSLMLVLAAPGQPTTSGADSPAHQLWSLQPLDVVAPPLLDHAWPVTPVDGFVLERLHAAQLHPSPPADRTTLIRRLYFDLLGVPPSPTAVRAFLADERPDAYGRLVDRVLASPQYGVRWAQHWLDVVRYGETHGFETNRERETAYHYRDYVVNALNGDLPYDRFVREQLAGDALGADAATGFLVAGPHDIVKSPDINLTLAQRQDELTDMVSTTGTAMLGLTIGCARCHDHKFDPITQRDFYALQAVFSGVEHRERALRSAHEPQLQTALATQQQQRKALQHAIMQLPLRAQVKAKKNDEQLKPVRAQRVRMTITATNSNSEPCIDELEVFAVEPNEAGHPVNVALAARGARVTASSELPGYSYHKIRFVNDGKYGNGHSWISHEPGKGWVEIELDEPTTIDRITWGRDREGNYRDRLATQYSISVADEDGTWKEVANGVDRIPYGLGQEGARPQDIAASKSRLTAAEWQQLLKLSAELEACKAEIKRIKSQLADAHKAYIGSFKEPEPVHVLHRGDPLARRERVPPDTLSICGSLGLNTSTPEQQRRLALAEWITRRDNPLTARVVVNRIWQHHFGRGIVATPSDFGFSGVPPTHAALLDWLANELLRADWSLKHFHRLIVSSQTYRQSSRPRTSALAVDGSTELLWRFPPRRLEAEAIRDSVLAASGCLDLSLGGHGFYMLRVQRENVWHYHPKENFGPREWRRMLYAVKIRQERDDVFGAFDCPDGGQAISRRSRSTTPLQALNLLNSQFMITQAEHLSARVRDAAGRDVGDQVTHLFWLTLGRPPDAVEHTATVQLTTDYDLMAACRALLNANEFLFIP